MRHRLERSDAQVNSFLFYVVIVTVVAVVAVLVTIGVTIVVAILVTILVIILVIITTIHLAFVAVVAVARVTSRTDPTINTPCQLNRPNDLNM